jgi:hypothetical protein
VIRFLIRTLLCIPLIAVAADAADMDKLLTLNMEAYSGRAEPMVDVTAQGKNMEQALSFVYGERFGKESYLGWKPGEAVDVIIDLRGVRVVKTVHIRFGGDVSNVELSYSVDRAKWHHMDAKVVTYPDKITWLEAVDFAAPARYVRLLGTSGDTGLSVSNTRIYGADEIGQVDLVDGVYATPAPAVAGTSIGLNVIIANTSSGPLDNLQVEVRQQEPSSRLLGKKRRKTLAPHRSMMFTVPWNPVRTEPHRIVVAVQKQHKTDPVETSVTLPVVNRRLWFASAYRWATFEGPTSINLSTPYRVEHNPGLIRTLKRRGGYYLRGAMTANTGGKKDANLLAADFVAVMDLADGVCIDEYLTAPEETVAIDVAALTRARQERPEKIIAPWTTGTDYALELFQTTADIVLMESYMTIYGPKNYEDRFGDQIKSVQKYGISDRAILVQGIFGDRNRPMAPEDLENSIRFVRHTAPEIPGMGGYGGWIRGPTADVYRLCDELCYKYFIAPVITPDGEPEAKGHHLELDLQNIGGMDASDVRVAAVDAETGQELGRSGAIKIAAGGISMAAIPLPDGIGKTMPDIRILPSDRYTTLQYLSPLDLYRKNRAEEGGITVSRIGYLGGDPDGTAPMPDDAWVSEDETPKESRDDYHQLNRHHPASGGVHPSAVLDLGSSPQCAVTRIQCRGYPHFKDLTQYAELLKNLRLLVSDDNITYKPIAAGYEAKWNPANLQLFVIDGLQTRARYIKINSTYEYDGKGYWIPKAPDDLDPLYKAGDGGMIGWDVYLED